MLRIKVGREIGSAALIADGHHARVDGWTALAVLAGAIGVYFGFPLADPIAGIVITIAILGVVWTSATHDIHANSRRRRAGDARRSSRAPRARSRAYAASRTCVRAGSATSSSPKRT